jgi:hypothetical protein
MDSREPTMEEPNKDLESHELPPPTLRDPRIRRMPLLRPNADIELHDMMRMIIGPRKERSSPSQLLSTTLMIPTSEIMDERMGNHCFSSLEVDSSFHDTIDNNNNHPPPPHNDKRNNDDDSRKMMMDFCVVCHRPSMFRCDGCRDVKGSYCESLCQSIDWPDHQKTCWRGKIPEEETPSSPSSHHHVPSSDLNEELDSEKLFLEELRFYTHQVWLILFPVTACITIVIWGVKTIAVTGFLRSGYVSVYEVPVDASSSQIFAGALINALIMMAAVVIATLLVVILFLCRCFKVS